MVIDGESEEISRSVERPFNVVTHKTALARYFAHLGAEQHFGNSADPDTAPLSLWWCPQDWAAKAAKANIDFSQLLAPTPGFVARLDRKWLGRAVAHLRKGDIVSFYAKHPDQVTETPQVVVSTGGDYTELIPPTVCPSEDLAKGLLPAPYDSLADDVLLQLEQPIPCVIEVRYWVANGELTAACPYRLGMVGWESNFFLEMLFNDQGRELVSLADDVAHRFAAEVNGPPGFAFDLGVTSDGDVIFLRAWPSWGVDPLGADPTRVWTSIVAAHDFDQIVDYDVWRWDPDLRFYDRDLFNEVEEASEPTEEETEDA